MSETKALPCIVCGRELPALDIRDNHPNGGTEFTSLGHYGSSVHDPMDGSRMAINVCDSCLQLAKKQGRTGMYDTEGFRPIVQVRVA